MRVSLQANEDRIQHIESQVDHFSKKIDLLQKIFEENRVKIDEMEDTRRQVGLLHDHVSDFKKEIEGLRSGSDSKGAAVVTQEQPLNMPVAPALNVVPAPTAATANTQLEKRLAMVEVRLIRLEQNILQVPGKTKAMSPLKSSKTPEDVRNALSKQLNNRRYGEVIQGASQLLADGQWARMESKKPFLHMALQYRAEAHFLNRDYAQAAVDLYDALENYPASDRTPRLILLLGDSFVYLKNTDMAKNYYEQCVQQFPSRKECQAAQERLKNLNGQ